MQEKCVTAKIAGPAGLGIKSAGQLLSKILIHQNFNIVDYSEYPSLVRGGHNTYQLTLSNNQVYAPHYLVDLFFSVSPGHWRQHLSEFTPSTLVFSDETTVGDTERAQLFNLPLKELASQVGNPVVVNTICVGAAVFLLDLDLESAKLTLQKEFKKNTQLNLQAFELGYGYAQSNFSSQKIKTHKSVKENSEKYFHDGNESFGWGFIKGKGSFYAAYPMTPATGTLHFLADKQAEYKITVVHPEDEIAAANMVAGAAFAGARAATGTSGGGFALMNEAISFCGVAEIGAVFYLVSRPGPATGMPTWTAQADLMHAVYSGHGEFPKVVIAPGDRRESFEFGVEALNLAAQLQTPVIVLSDKFVAESASNTPDFSTTKIELKMGEIAPGASGYRRYDTNTTSGVSPVSLPGTPQAEFLSNSYEHDELGFSTEDPFEASAMAQKRMKKQMTAHSLTPKPLFFGNNQAKKLIVSWGSTKGPILEAMKLIEKPEDYAFLQIRTLWPINPDIRYLIDGFKEVIVIENNQTAQLVTLLKSQFDFHPGKVITKYDGRPYFPEEIVENLRENQDSESLLIKINNYQYAK